MEMNDKYETAQLTLMQMHYSLFLLFLRWEKQMFQEMFVYQTSAHKTQPLLSVVTKVTNYFTLP